MKKIIRPTTKRPPRTPIAIPAFVAGLVFVLVGLEDDVALDDAAASVGLDKLPESVTVGNWVPVFNVVEPATASVDSPLRLTDSDGSKDPGRDSDPLFVPACAPSVSLEEAAVTWSPVFVLWVVSAGTPTVV